LRKPVERHFRAELLAFYQGMEVSRESAAIDRHAEKSLRIKRLVGAQIMQENMESKINAVLVHGAWADGSSWSKVITALEDDVST
jgi:hypothetical protein